MTFHPRLSVVMPVKNAAPYLTASIRSILQQTFWNFDFIIRDDGSTDGSREIIREWAARDDRIRLIASDVSLGPAGSANDVVRESRAPLIARMDGDDIAHPDRLRRQLAVLDANPHVVLCGTLSDTIDGEGRTLRDGEVWRLRRNGFFPPFAHGSIMFRREAFESAGGYRAQCNFWEDIDLMLRLCGTGQAAVIAEVLYHYRFHQSGSRLKSSLDDVVQAYSLMHETLEESWGKGSYAASFVERAYTSGVDAHPMAYVSLGTASLWSGMQPRVLASLLRHGRPRLHTKWLLSVLWSAWAEAAPGTLKFALGGLSRARSLLAKRHFDMGRTYAWAPGTTAKSSVPLMLKSS